MRKFLQWLLRKPVLWLSKRFSSSPDKARIFEALTALLTHIRSHPGKKGITVPFDLMQGKFILFSDQHMGVRDGADDFRLAESNYLQALEYYYHRGFTLVNLGDSEELWENKIPGVAKHNKALFALEKKFLAKNAFIKIFGNHDIFWHNDPFAPLVLRWLYGQQVKAYEGCLLQTQVNGQPLSIFCTHGHQGDGQSDGNPFSAWFVANIWAPLQSYLEINPNTPAYDAHFKSEHNRIMYDWAIRQPDLLLVTGHTHQPVFESLTHLERLHRDLIRVMNQDESAANRLQAEIRKRKIEYTTVRDEYLKYKPTYFNTGCCCYIDGDITGIEIEDGMIRLVKWTRSSGETERRILEEIGLEKLTGDAILEDHTSFTPQDFEQLK